MNYSEFTAHAYKCTSNHGGIEIMLNDSGDGVYFVDNYGQDNKVVEESEIFYDDDEEGSAYFLNGEDKEYLDEYLKV